jgi:hypothetical protein
MLTSILGTRLRWHLADGWIFDPVIVGPDIIDYTLKEGPHLGRHAIQHTYYERVAAGIETTAWYEESGAVLHVTWYLQTQRTRRFAALPACSPRTSGRCTEETTRTPRSSRTSKRSAPSARTGLDRSFSIGATSWCSDRPPSPEVSGSWSVHLAPRGFPAAPVTLAVAFP